MGPHPERIVREGDSQAWVLNAARAKQCTWLVCTQNRHNPDHAFSDATRNPMAWGSWSEKSRPSARRRRTATATAGSSPSASTHGSMRQAPGIMAATPCGTRRCVRWAFIRTNASSASLPSDRNVRRQLPLTHTVQTRESG